MSEYTPKKFKGKIYVFWSASSFTKSIKLQSSRLASMVVVTNANICVPLHIRMNRLFVVVTVDAPHHNTFLFVDKSSL